MLVITSPVGPRSSSFHWEHDPRRRALTNGEVSTVYWAYGQVLWPTCTVIMWTFCWADPDQPIRILSLIITDRMEKAMVDLELSCWMGRCTRWPGRRYTEIENVLSFSSRLSRARRLLYQKFPKFILLFKSKAGKRKQKTIRLGKITRLPPSPVISNKSRRRIFFMIASTTYLCRTSRQPK